MTPVPNPTADVLGIPLAGAEGMPKRFGKYTLLRRLATGGMAEVFLALQTGVAGFEKLVVIKRVLPSINADQAFVDMLLHEARIAATFSHPNIVQVYDVGFAEGAFFIAMEHIHGEDLRSIVHQMKQLHLTEFPLEHALGIALGLCAGLAYAHEKRGLDDEPLRIVHRDISPHNVIVTYGGDIKIIDFGIAKSGDQIGEDTKSGRLKGKVPYMSPEQASGNDIDSRSDIFAIGIILFELTTGKRLFKGRNDLETLRLICDRVYPNPQQVYPGYPSRLEPIVIKALSKDPNQRYQSARQMQADLEAYIREERVPVSTIGLREWMQQLYQDKLTRQKSALHDLKQLANVFSTQSPTESNGYDGGMSSTNYSMVPATPAFASLVPVPPTSKFRSLGKVGFVVLGVAAVAVGGMLLSRAPTTSQGFMSDESAKAPDHQPLVRSGTLHLVTTPPGAAVWINGSLRPEKTPSTINNLPKEIEISLELTMEGFAPVRDRVTFDRNNLYVRLEHELSLGTVTILLETNAPDAKLLINQRTHDGFRIEGLAANEEHEILVSAAGYKSQIVRVSGGPNTTKQLSVNLERGEGTSKGKLDVTSPDTP